MIKTEQISEKLIKSYSDNNKMIKPVYDRLGKDINPNAMYDVAVDIVVDGQPRYDYEETDQEVETIDCTNTAQPLEQEGARAEKIGGTTS